jgi:hypothetical protein
MLITKIIESIIAQLNMIMIAKILRLMLKRDLLLLRVEIKADNKLKFY